MKPPKCRACGVGEWRHVCVGGRSRLIRQTDVDRMALEGDYAAIDGLIRGISLDLTYSRRVAQKRRVFRTRQRSIKVRVS